MPVVRDFFEKLFPTTFRWLEVMHLDHIMDFSSPLRMMLAVSCLISLFFGISWLMEFLQLSCFVATPWTKEGVGMYTCLWQLIGGIVLLSMFQHTAVALFYYDDDGDQLREKKEAYLEELQKDCSQVLQRANAQAQKLCGMLAADLGDKVADHVDHCTKILGKLKQDPSFGSELVYERLATQMAHHLHRLRQPAIDRFEKLIALSGQSFLAEILRSERRESMLLMVTGGTMGGNKGGHGMVRTETAGSDLEEEGFHMGAYRSQFSIRYFDCCGSPFSQCAFDGDQTHPKTPSSVDRRIRLPTEADLQDVLKDFGASARHLSPEKVVLRPLRLVMRWYEVVDEMHGAGKSTAPTSPAGGAAYFNQQLTRPFAPLAQELQLGQQDVGDRCGRIWEHLWKSPMYRCMLLGMVCSFAIFWFYLHMLWTVVGLLREGGECRFPTLFACLGAFAHYLVGVLAMLCHTIAIGVVLWNIDRLDAVLQAHQEIGELEDFRRQVHKINAADINDGDDTVAMVEVVLQQLAEQKKFVNEFYNKSWGGSVQLADFDALATKLERALGSALPPRAPRRSGAASASTPSALPSAALLPPALPAAASGAAYGETPPGGSRSGLSSRPALDAHAAWQSATRQTPGAVAPPPPPPRRDAGTGTLPQRSAAYAGLASGLVE